MSRSEPLIGSFSAPLGSVAGTYRRGAKTSCRQLAISSESRRPDGSAFKLVGVSTQCVLPVPPAIGSHA